MTDRRNLTEENPLLCSGWGKCGKNGCSGSASWWVALVAVVFAAAHMLSGKKSSNVEPESSMVIETTFASDDIRVNGIFLTGMTRAEAKEYPWKVTVTYNGETLDADNILDAELETFLDGICTVKAAGDSFSFCDCGLFDKLLNRFVQTVD